MNKYEGNLISIEGIDGSGTTTLCENLKEEFGTEEWEFTSEPSNGKYGRLARRELQSDSDPTTSDFFLFCADRVDHIQSLIGPKLNSGINVVTDRYNLSTYAYQSSVVKEDIVSRSGVEYIDTVVSEWVIEPDITIVLDLPVEQSMGRMTDGTEKYEKKNRLEKASEIYNRFSENKENVSTIDATQSEDEVLNNVLDIINSLQ